MVSKNNVRFTGAHDGPIAEIRALLDGFGAGLQDDTAVLPLGVPRGPSVAGR